MKVLYDHQSFTGLAYGGVSRYFFDLMSSFTERSDVEFELSLLLSNNEYLDQASFSHHLRYKRLAHVKNVNRVASLLNRLYSLRRVKAGKFDIFHPTYYHRYFLDSIGKKPFVISFHDATSERFGDKYPDLGAGLYEKKKELLQRASAIIAISEFSKQEIAHFFPDVVHKTKVVHLSTTFGTQQNQPVAVSSQPGAARIFDYILYVGKRGLYKNFDNFFRAIRPVMHRHPNLHLICAGGGHFNGEERKAFQTARLHERVHFENFDDTTLFNLYQQARAFVFPSLNEGFGIPVLEAFSAGCPAVLSNRSSLPEVGGDAALYFDPEDDDSMADAIERVVTDDTLRNDLRRKGTERLRSFSCEKTAQQTLDVYKSLA